MFIPRYSFFSLFLALLASVLVGFTPVYAGETLVNSEITVDVTGKDASSARAEAMAKAEVEALIELLGRFTPPGQAQEIIAGMDAKRINTMVRGTEVLEEKISENRYRARLLVSFDGDEIGSLVSTAGPSKNSNEAPPPLGAFLVIPSYEENGETSLWEDGNPWRMAWRKVGLETASGDVVVPYGDTRDVAVVDARTVASANYASLVPMIVRYGVTDVLVLQAKFSETPDMVLEVVKRRFNRTQNEVMLLTYRADPQETKENLLSRAARDVAERTQVLKTEELSNVKKARGGERRDVMMLANITTISSWTELRKKLSTLPMVDNIDVLAVSPQQVDIRVHYRGSEESLSTAVIAQKLRLVKGDKYWVVSRD